MLHFRSCGAILIYCALAALPGALAACERSAPVPEPHVPSVAYRVIKPEPLILVREFPGRVSSAVISEVRPQVSGIIQERLFVEGADVKAGDVLYRMESGKYRSAYNNARAELMMARANLDAARKQEERCAALIKSNAVTRQDYENAQAAHARIQAQIAAGEAALEAAAIDLEYTEIKAPVSGRIGRSTVTPGALVTQHQEAPLAAIQQLDSMYVDITQSTSEWLALRDALASGRLQPHDDGALRVSLLLENGRPYTQLRSSEHAMDGNSLLTGKLMFTDVTVSQNTGVLTIRTLFPNPDGILLPGMHVRAMVEEGTCKDAILVPQKAVSRDRDGTPSALVLEADSPQSEGRYRVKRRPLVLGRAVGNCWLVDAGLQKGELLLVEGVQRVRDGQPVRGVADSGQHMLTGSGMNRSDDIR